MTDHLHICHLYPVHMALYGDRGNVITLSHRARLRHIRTHVQLCMPGEPIDPRTRLIMIGGGQDNDQEKIVTDLLSRRSEMTDLLHGGCVLLAICGGYQLLGHYYETADRRIDGLGIVDLHTRRAGTGERRIIGNLLTVSERFGTMYGFENHGGRTYLGSELSPLATVRRGGGNNGTDLTEGVYVQYGAGLIVGTYIHTVLPRNPSLTDHLLWWALGCGEPLVPMDSVYARAALSDAYTLRY